MPNDIDLKRSIEYNQRLGGLDGVAEIDPDGIVYFTDAAKNAVRDIDPGLADALDSRDLKDRTSRLRRIISDMGAS